MNVALSNRKTLDISHLRLKVFIEMLREQHADLASRLNKMNEEMVEVVNGINRTPWLSVSIEVSTFETLCEEFDAWDDVMRVGQQSVSAALSFLMPTLPKKATLDEIIHRIPVFINLFMTHMHCFIENEDDTKGNYFVHFTYRDSKESNISDILFLKGIITGIIKFFRLDDFSVIALKSPINESEKAKSLIKSELEYNGDELLFQIDNSGEATSATLVNNEDNGEKSIDTYDAFVQDVLKRSAELLKDKRELMTAVEYLNMANEELEKEIRANKKELKMARNIQKGFVPSSIPDWKGLQFWVKFFPLTEVSGDFYDFFPIGGDKLALLVADVSGHGVPAALISAIAKLSFSSHRLESPADIFSKVNLDLLRYVKREGYLCAVYLIVKSDYNVIYSIGAAPRPLLFRHRTKQVEKLPGSGTLLGMFPDASELYMDQSTHLEPGDKLIVFTDGIVEAENDRNDSMGEDHLAEALKQSEGLDVQESGDYLIDYYRQYILGMEAKDDVTLLTITLSERVEEFEKLINRARAEHNSGNLNRACAALRSAIEIFPRHTNTLFLLGKYLARSGKYEEAAEYLYQYTGLKPYNADALTIVAYCSYKLIRFEKAKEELKRSLSLRSENPSALYNLIKVHIKLAEFEEAENVLSALEFLRPKHPKVSILRQRIEAAKNRAKDDSSS
jgi:serine phosphatase RsbU (regulator of sigma subunit)